jgi:hypothetical protein
MENINQPFQIPEISKASSHLMIHFSARDFRNTPITVALYALNGARVGNYRGTLRSGGRSVAMDLPEMPISPNIYVCAIVAGNRSFTKLISCAR